VRIEAAICALALYLFVVHTVMADQPFIRLSMFKDRNFLTGNIFIFVVGAVLFATLALAPPMLQGLMGYSVLQAGLVTAPRGVGMFVAMALSSRLVTRFDSRLVIGTGFLLTAVSLYGMTNFSLEMDMQPLIWTGAVQGLGTGMVFVTLSALTFATLPAAARNEGTAMFNLMRNIGSSIGIATVQGLMVRNMQVVHSTLSEHVTPLRLAASQFATGSVTHSAMAINREINVQAAMMAYLDNFQLMLILTLLAMPLLLLIRTGSPKAGAAHVVLD
jgi:DHA2 family multidrug resistance protein